MKYFIDTEFIEGFHKPIWGKKRHFIDLISISILSEDGRIYEAVSSEYSYSEASDWVKQNVISSLYTDKISGPERQFLHENSFHKKIGKKNKEIAFEIYKFICSYQQASQYAGIGSIDEGGRQFLLLNPPEFYAYYADYDWVLFCSLFENMMNLPAGFPMYCKDLKQMLDDKAISLVNAPLYGAMQPITFDQALLKIKNDPYYPKECNSHTSKEDAVFNFNLYNFLTGNTESKNNR